MPVAVSPVMRVAVVAFAAVALTRPASAESVPAEPDKNFEYSVTFWVGDLFAPALVDTGSTFSVLTDVQVARLRNEGLAQPYGTMTARTGAGTATLPLYSVSQFRLGTCLVNGPFIVVEGPFSALGAQMLHAIRPWHFDEAALIFTCPSPTMGISSHPGSPTAMMAPGRLGLLKDRPKTPDSASRHIDCIRRLRHRGRRPPNTL